MTDLEEQYYSPSSVAEMFEVTPATVREWISANKLSAIKLPGGRLRIPISAVRRLANERYGDSGADTQ